eukprot:6798988-Prymnesium_polylepis.1
MLRSGSETTRCLRVGGRKQFYKIGRNSAFRNYFDLPQSQRGGPTAPSRNRPPRRAGTNTLKQDRVTRLMQRLELRNPNDWGYRIGGMRMQNSDAFWILGRVSDNKVPVRNRRPCCVVSRVNLLVRANATRVSARRERSDVFPGPFPGPRVPRPPHGAAAVDLRSISDHSYCTFGAPAGQAPNSLSPHTLYDGAQCTRHSDLPATASASVFALPCSLSSYAYAAM